MNDTERLREILGNLTFIVGMAHVKGAHGEIDSDAVVARTNDEINKAESQLQTLLDEARKKACLSEQEWFLGELQKLQPKDRIVLEMLPKVIDRLTQKQEN